MIIITNNCVGMTFVLVCLKASSELWLQFLLIPVCREADLIRPTLKTPTVNPLRGLIFTWEMLMVGHDLRAGPVD